MRTFTLSLLAFALSSCGSQIDTIAENLATQCAALNEEIACRSAHPPQAGSPPPAWNAWESYHRAVPLDCERFVAQEREFMAHNPQYVPAEFTVQDVYGNPLFSVPFER